MAQDTFTFELTRQRLDTLMGMVLAAGKSRETGADGLVQSAEMMQWFSQHAQMQLQAQTAVANSIENGNGASPLVN